MDTPAFRRFSCCTFLSANAFADFQQIVRAEADQISEGICEAPIGEANVVAPVDPALDIERPRVSFLLAPEAVRHILALASELGRV
ncbi:MAG: hypothetical protein AAGJ87_16175 [Pseudomonadota bacterium]